MSDKIDQASDGSGREPHQASILPLDRFAAFSDGVFAIAITILVLELAVPAESVPLRPALLGQWPEFLGYFMSFSIIGGIWISHAGLSKLMRHGDSIAYGFNLLMLLFVSLLPFTTSIMVTHLTGPEIRIAVIIYGFNILVASVALSLLMFYVARHPRLLVDEVADNALKSIYRQRLIAIGVGIGAVTLAFVAPRVAVGLYVVEAVLFLVLPLVGVSRDRRNRAR